MIRLTTKQVIFLHSSLIEATGGTDGVRDIGLLESALEAPFQTFDGKDLYPALIQKAARLGQSLISNHPFVDGNKRIGIHTMLVFLAANGVEIECTQKELIDVGLSLADGTMNAEKLLIWLSSHN
ncbi:MAG: type II toxin-antitoxin system death-on-curing family toxin [Oscillospiraceae bacterium]|jgi:death-on-curing protein|nr:type II toxin-antitoxin system death-on-curing family toxin [Oscillospiraceae bacterium]